MSPEEYYNFDKFLSETRLDVKDIMIKESRFQSVFDKLYTYMKMGFENECVRKHPLHFSFDKVKVYTMEVRHFIVNMICWYPMTRMEIVDKLDESYIIDCSNLSKKILVDYFNDKIIEPFRTLVSVSKLNQIIADVVYRLGQISLDFNEIMAISISIKTFIDLDSRNEDFHDLIHTRLNSSMQPKDIEIVLDEKLASLLKILKKEDNSIRPILNSGEGIKTKQLSEFLISGGLKPDMIGNTIPVPINTNYMVGGLNSVSSFFVDKQAGRKAVVANKMLMGNAGYFAAKIMKITKDTRVDLTVEDCGTNVLVNYFVKDEAHLKTINRLYYCFGNHDRLKVVDYKRDKHLIGQIIRLRTPVTCGLDRNHVCKTCYGQMYLVNDDEQFGHGSYSSAISANKFQQDTLSIKHLQTTNSIEVEFPDIFYEVFSLDSSILSINPDNIENPKKWKIVIDENKLVEFDELEFNSNISQITLVDLENNEEYIISEAHGSEIFIYQDAISMFTENENNQLELLVSKLTEELSIGIIVIENNEMTKPLKNLQRLLDSKDHFDCYTIDELVNKCADLIIEAGVNVTLVHYCMTLRNLIRKKGNIYEFPEFSSFKEPEYMFMKLTEALVNNPSLTTGLSSQNLRSQFSDYATYNKHAKSSTDVYFKKNLTD